MCAGCVEEERTRALGADSMPLGNLPAPLDAAEVDAPVAPPPATVQAGGPDGDGASETKSSYAASPTAMRAGQRPRRVSAGSALPLPPARMVASGGRGGRGRGGRA